MASPLRRIFIFLFIVASFADAKVAKCSRSDKVIKCVNANRGVIKRLGIYYRNDTSLIVGESSIGILETGIFEHLIFLEKLRLSKCGLNFIQDRVFRGLNNLTHLNLAGNSIRNVTIGVFQDLDNLQFLDLSNNAITSLDLSLTKLIHFDASNNRLENISLTGNFTELETVNIEDNLLTVIPIDQILHYPRMKSVFFGGNLFNKSYESFLIFTLVSSEIRVDIDNARLDDGWNSVGTDNGISSVQRSSKFDIENDFKLSPDFIKSLNHSQLADLVERILIIRNFTLTEKKIIEIDRKRIIDESKNVKKEYERIDQILKRYYEVYTNAKEEAIGEYIEKV